MLKPAIKASIQQHNSQRRKIKLGRSNAQTNYTYFPVSVKKSSEINDSRREAPGIGGMHGRLSLPV